MAEPTPSQADAPPLIYLDVDDEITSAASRIRAAEAERLALVLPYGSRLATSRINFRLLAREAAERGKQLEIVCADSSARALAAAAGLTVHPSVAAFEGHHAGSGGNGTSAAAGVADAAAEGAAPIAAGAPTGATASAPAVEAAGATGPGVAAVPTGGLSIEDDAPTRIITLPRQRSRPVPRIGPPRPPVRTGVAIGIGVGALVLLVVGAFVAVELLPSATIVLAPRSEEIGPLELTVQARPDVATADPEALVIPAQRATFTVEASQTITPTGTKVTETKATGSVTFSNFDNGGGVFIPAGTIVRTDDRKVQFTTLADLTLPRARQDFFPPFATHPSQGSVGIEAVEPGEGGNVGNNTITDVVGGGRLLQVNNPQPTTGGAHSETPEISQSDVDTALAAIGDALAAELGRQVDAGIGVPVGVTVYPATQAVGDPEYSVDPKTLVGSTEPTVELTATAEGTVLGVDSAPVASLAEATLQSRVDEGWSLAPSSVSFTLDTPVVVGEVARFPVTIAGTQVRNVDRDALLESVRGLLVGDARARLDDFGDVNITVWPDWVTAIPKNPDRITFTLTDPAPAPSPTP